MKRITSVFIFIKILQILDKLKVLQLLTNYAEVFFLFGIEYSRQLLKLLFFCNAKILDFCKKLWLPSKVLKNHIFHNRLQDVSRNVTLERRPEGRLKVVLDL